MRLANFKITPDSEVTAEGDLVHFALFASAETSGCKGGYGERGM